MADFVPAPARATAGTAIAADAARGQLLEPDLSGYDRTGVASWYGGRFHGRVTAVGEIFDRTDLTAAHPSLPLPSYVRVTNLENDRSIVLRVNDRGPYSGGRLLDVSEQAAELLAFRHHGSTKVRVQYVSRAPRNTDDTAMLLATYRGPSLPVADLMAFTPLADDPILGRGAASALKRVTQAAAAEERIVMAFDVADQVDNE
jgi:rare lipoprotein A (peptidoglycan hydrolase)